MHPTAKSNCEGFYRIYGSKICGTSTAKVVEIGSQDLNGNLREVFPQHTNYIGVDFSPGKGVDIIIEDPYQLPFEDESVDIVLSSSCLEHSEMFWLVFIEMIRILKPHGLCYLNVPANGGFHRHPVDCWRFYPDSGNALVTWSKRNGFSPALMESYTSTQHGDLWNDFVAVFLKDENLVERYPDRITKSLTGFYNGCQFGSKEIYKPQGPSEDQLKLLAIQQIIENKLKLI
ncbi:MAG: class I SAM-dependent methyltransferase [Betaproteobacteria bacterium]|nr:class I SAM-dependent methyltransferase [Betaproteobacteria bacterium]